MPTVITLKVDSLPPMKNALRGRHWSAGYKAKREWSWLIMAATSPMDRITLRAWAAADTCLEIKAILETKNLFDEDNLSSAGNVVLDALKWCNLIANDDPDHVKFPKPIQVKGKKASLTLTITPYV